MMNRKWPTPLAAWRRRFARLCLLVLVLPVLTLPAMAATAPATDQTRIEQAAVAAYRQGQEAANDQRVANNAPLVFDTETWPVLGNPRGDVTIVEFFDYNCPYSRAVQSRVEALLKADPGIRLILRPFTIENVSSSITAGRAAFASIKQGRFAVFHQAMLDRPGDGFMTAQTIDSLARDAGLDVARLHADMDAPQAYIQLIDNFNQARALRIFDTPTFVIDGHIVTEPSADLDFLKLVAAVRAKPLLQRLLVTGSRTLAVVNPDPGLKAALTAPEAPPGSADVVVVFAANRADLTAQLPILRTNLFRPTWVAYRKSSDLSPETVETTMAGIDSKTGIEIPMNSEWTAVRLGP
ncbi:MAG: hypothetical protein JWM33_2535 [Caulobacteraceae bacterium]|nr:hypothetical protein [Caulobacteraceae bacterium]